MRLEHNGPYLDGARAGTLMLQRCTACGHVPNFPRVGCPRCLGALEWFEGSGRGEVVTFTVVHRPDHRYDQHVPIVMALLRLAEGAETIATIVGDDRLEAGIGAQVEVTGDGWSELPQFTLVS